jgi:hypothetical protein
MVRFSFLLVIKALVTYLREMITRILLYMLIFFNSFASANEQQWREMQQDLKTLKLYQGEIDGQLNDGFKVAIELYLKNKKIGWSVDDVLSDPSKLLYDIDLEERLFSGKSVFNKAIILKTPRAEINLISYTHAEDSTLFTKSWRLIVNDELVLAGHLPFSECCSFTTYAFSDYEIIALKGKGGNAACGAIEILLVVDDKKTEILGAPRICAAPIQLEQQENILIMKETDKNAMLTKHFKLLKTGELKFDRLALNGQLSPLTRFEGKTPLWMNEKGERALFYPPLLEALTTLLDPEALGWMLKMNTSNVIERRGNLLFINGQFKEDETHLTITLDIGKNAVHICTIKNGVTRFVSTLLEKSFTDPDSSCPLTVEEAENIWAALELLEMPSDIRVFSIEGIYQFTDDAEDKLVIKAREAILPDGKKCTIDSIAFSDKSYVLDTSCQQLTIKPIKDNRYSIDGDEAIKQ